MSRTIWKSELESDGTVEFPRGSQILTVQMQNDLPYVWAIVDMTQEKEVMRLSVYGTGHPMPDDPGRYIGTFQINDGEFIFHLFQPNNRGENNV